MNDDRMSDFAQALSDLGFSQYEAKCYVGLMNREPQTGYRVSKATGVPQPKVYETLRRLVSRGVVREIPGEPTVFSAIPPRALFDDLRGSFERRLEEAERSARAMAASELPRDLEYVERFTKREDVVEAVKDCLAAASRRVYLSASANELAALKPAVDATLARGVDVVVLAFGRREVPMRGARIFRHASTEGAVYRRHQARHIALVVDSRETVNAIAADGSAWQGIRTASVPIIAAVKGFIRHDIDMQQVYADFGEKLVEAYGPGLQELESYRQEASKPATRVDEADGFDSGAPSVS
ncbi:TrmB family transcriptional regulator, partial [Amycolatopsis thermoflava]